MSHDASEPVTLYTTPICPYCVSAKRLLESRGIPFREVDLSSEPELRAELSQQTGMRTVPMVFIGEECIGGYTELAALDSSGELDRLLDK